MTLQDNRSSSNHSGKLFRSTDSFRRFIRGGTTTATAGGSRSFPEPPPRIYHHLHPVTTMPSNTTVPSNCEGLTNHRYFVRNVAAAVLLRSVSVPFDSLCSHPPSDPFSESMPMSQAQINEIYRNNQKMEKIGICYKISQRTDCQWLSLCTKPIYSLRINNLGLKSFPSELLHKVSKISKLCISDCYSLKSFTSNNRYPNCLEYLSIVNCYSFVFPPPQKLTVLRHLIINKCTPLTTLPMDLFPNLVMLRLSNCPNLISLSVSVPEASPICLPAIKSLEIEECPNLKSVLHKGLTIPNLQSLSLKSCSNLTEVPNSYPHLYFLGLLKCPKLDLFSYVNLPSKLDAIEIDPCETCIPQELELYSLYMEGGCTDLEILPLPTKIEFLAAKFMLCSSLENELKHLTATLTTIQIYSCPELHSLGDDLSQLEKLKTIRIHSCPKLHSLPLLPSSLTFLRIEECPILAKKLLEEERTSSLKIDIYT
ncbi:hypothetical protein ACSQ67_021961 [Phaseolus vulgaris]